MAVMELKLMLQYEAGSFEHLPKSIELEWTGDPPAFGSLSRAWSRIESTGAHKAHDDA